MSGAVELAAPVIGDHDRVRARSTTMRASSTCWMPLTISGPDQLSGSHDRSRGVRLGSNIWLISSATVPSQEVREANTRDRW